MKARKGKGRRSLALFLAFAMIFTTFLGDMSVVKAEEITETEPGYSEGVPEPREQPEVEVPVESQPEAEPEESVVPEVSEVPVEPEESVVPETPVVSEEVETAPADTVPAEAPEQVNTYAVKFSENDLTAGTVWIEGQQVDTQSFTKDVQEGSDFIFRVVPNEGWEVESVRVNETDIERTGNPDEYIIRSVAAEAEVVVRYMETSKEEADEESDADKKEEEVPEEVQEFLDAVAALPSADEVTKENAEDIGGQVNALLNMWEALDEEFTEREDVAEALERLYEVYEAVCVVEDVEEAEPYLSQIPGFTPADRFYSKGEEVAQLYIGTYPNNPVYKYKNPSTSIEIKVGETGYDQRLYTKSAICYCGNVLVEVTPDWIAVDSKRKLSNSDPTIVKDLTWNLAGYTSEDPEDNGYKGYPALQMNVEGAKPGNTTIIFQSYQNYYYAYYWQQCKRCGQQYKEISFKGKWIEGTDTVNVTVFADYVLNYDTQGGSSIAPEKKTEASTQVEFSPLPTPFKTGYTFEGWYYDEEGTIPVGEKAILNWEEGLGSTNNPVSATIYAKWKENDDSTSEKTYTVIYTDGVKGEIVFADQVYEGLSEGDSTPEFTGTPKREGYAFEGWAPTINPVVSKNDANDNGEIIYTATWSKKKITDFEKSLVKSTDKVPADINDSGITYPGTDGSVEIPDDGSITLLYKITVTGDPGKEYSVTDKGAVWVGGAAMSGVIPESGSAVIYVTKSFTKDDINSTGEVVNTATVSPGKDDENNTSSTETTPAATPEKTPLDIIKTAQAFDKNGEQIASPKAGDTVEYTIVVMNKGSYTAQNVIVKDNLDRTKLEEVSAVVDGKAAVKAGNVYQIGDLEPGKSVTLLITTKVKDNVPVGTLIENIASADCDNIKGEKPSDKADVTVGGSSLDISKTRTSSPVAAVGDTIIWKISITNNSIREKTVKVSDVLSNGKNAVVMYQGIPVPNDGEITVAAGQTVTLDASYVVQKGDVGTELYNTVTVTDPDEPDDPKKDTDEGTEIAGPERTVTIKYVSDKGEKLQEDAVITKNETGDPFKDGDVYDVSNRIPSTLDKDSYHYIWEETKGIPTGKIDGDVVIEVIYTVDDIGTNPQNPDEPDGIPDKYQATVIFRAVNGTVTGADENGLYKIVVTLLGEDGSPAKDGSALLPFVPMTSANEGYNPVGVWSPESPIANMTIIRGDREFVITYSPITPVTPEPEQPTPENPTPETPTPNPGTTPVVPVTPVPVPTAFTPTPAPVTPAPAAVVPVADEEVPLAVPEVTVDEADNTLTRVDDEAVPLAAGPHEHKCCILHFLILLLALIVELFYTKSMKKHQKKIFEARREITEYDIQHQSEAA